MQGAMRPFGPLTACVDARRHLSAAIQMAMSMYQRQRLPCNPVGREHASKIDNAVTKALLHYFAILLGVCLHHMTGNTKAAAQVCLCICH